MEATKTRKRRKDEINSGIKKGLMSLLKPPKEEKKEKKVKVTKKKISEDKVIVHKKDIKGDWD